MHEDPLDASRDLSGLLRAGGRLPVAGRQGQNPVRRQSAARRDRRAGDAATDLHGACAGRPQEAAGHRLVAVVSGTRIQGSGAGVAILAPRGSHTAQVAVLDAEGRTLARSGQVTFEIRPDTLMPISRELKAITRVQPAN